jgi:hypothetical protein
LGNSDKFQYMSHAANGISAAAETKKVDTVVRFPDADNCCVTIHDLTSEAATDSLLD